MAGSSVRVEVSPGVPFPAAAIENAAVSNVLIDLSLALPPIGIPAGYSGAWGGLSSTDSALRSLSGRLVSEPRTDLAPST
jgi:hypothetical protein